MTKGCFAVIFGMIEGFTTMEAIGLIQPLDLSMATEIVGSAFKFIFNLESQPNADLSR